ncbi:hypothetical protein MRS44_010296 [Fusarium solani]|uniref:uncharacterized protein n=1 Tax=Fusarium solani TaxID=169388 RepID=UPI0032C40E24|nr:hypothetical protein MRS44_010296 [Fusarium solani]
MDVMEAFISNRIGVDGAKPTCPVQPSPAQLGYLILQVKAVPLTWTVMDRGTLDLSGPSVLSNTKPISRGQAAHGPRPRPPSPVRRLGRPFSCSPTPVPVPVPVHPSPALPERRS